MLASVIGLALGWHISFFVVEQITKSRRRNPSTEKILESIERDLAKKLNQRLEGLSQDKLNNSPYQKWSKKSKYYLKRLGESY